MVYIEKLRMECKSKNRNMIFAIGKIIKLYGKIYVIKKCSKEDRNKIHEILVELNSYSDAKVYINENKDIQDAANIYFNSDYIWER
jgi:hypothetical protein